MSKQQIKNERTERYNNDVKETNSFYDAKIGRIEEKRERELMKLEQRYQEDLVRIDDSVRVDTEKLSREYANQRQAEVDAKNYAQSPEGRMKLTEMERREKIAKWTEEANQQGIPPSVYIQIKSETQDQRIARINKENQQEFESGLEVVSRSSKRGFLLDMGLEDLTPDDKHNEYERRRY